METNQNQMAIGEPINLLPATAAPGASMALAGADPAAVAAAEMARAKIQLAYFMATQKPRNQRAAWEQVMESCRRPKFAAAAIYRKPVGNSSIEGPSVRLAEEIIRRWGNIMVLTQVVFEDEAKRRVAVQIIDLETNNQYLKEIVTAKTVERKNSKDRDVVSERLNSFGDRVFIVRATEDELHNKEAAAISKAIRNEGLRLIPSDVVEDALTIARETRTNTNAADPNRAIKELVYWFNVRRVPVSELERFVGGPIDRATPEQVEELTGICQAIGDGETSWAAVMEARAGQDANANAKDATESRAAALKDQIAKAKGTGGAATSGAADGGKSEHPAAPVPEDPAPPAARSTAAEDPPEEATGAHGETAAEHLAEDPERQFAAVGFAAADLVDMSIEELIGHANRIRGLMDVGEKRTARASAEKSSEAGLIAVLSKIARREAGKR